MKKQSLKISLALPVVREAATDATSCTNPEAVAALLLDLAHMAQEAFCVVTLNTRNRVIDKHLVSLGTLDASIVHPREVFRPAILDGARSIIISHNHPSGDPSPSKEDVTITRQLISAGEILGISVLDHVIMGRGEHPFFSLRESGLAQFDK